MQDLNELLQQAYQKGAYDAMQEQVFPRLEAAAERDAHAMAI